MKKQDRKEGKCEREGEREKRKSSTATSQRNADIILGDDLVRKMVRVCLSFGATLSSWLRM